MANLLDADKNAIKIALTGTPLLKEERESWRVFGNYIHTYYYDKSILDGYTLKIIREDIETQYKERLSEIYEKLETLVEKKDVKKSQIVEHDNYVKELLRYIISDLKRFRQIQEIIRSAVWSFVKQVSRQGSCLRILMKFKQNLIKTLL